MLASAPTDSGSRSKLSPWTLSWHQSLRLPGVNVIRALLLVRFLTSLFSLRRPPPVVVPFDVANNIISFNPNKGGGGAGSKASAADVIPEEALLPLLQPLKTFGYTREALEVIISPYLILILA